MVIEVTFDVTDVYISTTVSPVYVNVSFEAPSGGGGTEWGDITGTLSDQTDLQTALDAKFDDPTGTSLQYIDGTGALQTFPLTLPVLQEVRNQTGATLDAGTVVYINGATGNKPTVTKAIATGDSTSAQTLGMVSASIANNGTGYVVVIGTCSGLDTSAFTEGQQLYLSGTTAGGVTTTKPYAPYHLVYIGIVTRAHPTLGTVEVRVQNGYELDEIHDVDALNPNNNDGIFYNTSTSLWEHKQISTALGYTPANAATTLTINGVSYDLSTSRTWSVGSVTGSGASGQVAYWTGASSQSGSNNLLYNDTNKSLQLINSTNSGTPRGFYLTQTTADGAGNLLIFQKSRGGVITSGTTVGVIDSEGFDGTSYQKSARISFTTSGTISSGIVPGTISFLTANTSGVLTGRVTINENGLLSNNGNFHNAGNTLLGSTTDSGQRLQVTGDTLLKGSGNTSATTALTVQNSDGANAFRVLNNGQINLGNSASFPLIRTVTEASVSTQAISGTKVLFVSQDTETGSGASFSFGSNTVLHTSGNLIFSQFSRDFIPTSGTGTVTTLRIGGTINQTGGANGITRGFYVNPTLTAAADWRSIEWSNSTGWGLYGAGSANNYLGGSLGIGTTSWTAISLNVAKNITGAITSHGVVQQGTIQTDVTAAGYGFRNILNTAASVSLTLYSHLRVGQSTIGAGTVIGTHFGIEILNLTTGTNIYGISSDISAGTGRWNLYMSGTAANYMNGELLLGSTTNTGEKLQVTGTVVIKDITTSSVASALLQLSSTTKGFLPPRMTTTQKNAISSPAAGLVVYDTTLNKLCVYTTAWETITSI